MKHVVVLLSLVAVGLALAPAVSAQGPLTVVVPASGSADAVLYRAACGEVGLVDAGEGAADDVLDQLDAWGVGTLAWVAPSHYDADHVGDVADIAQQVGVGVVFDRGGGRDAKNTDTYRAYYDWVVAAGIRQPVDIGDQFTLCDGAERVTFDVASAGTDGTAVDGVAVTAENDRSVCLHVEYGDFDLATCGDVNGVDDGDRADVETAVADEFGDVEVVKVNHEGSRFSSNPAYVATLSPEIAVVQVGDNPYGHPDPSVLDRWSVGADVLQTQSGDNGTQLAGDITITTAGDDTFTVVTNHRDATYQLDETAGTTPVPQARATDDSCPAGAVPEDGFGDADGTAHEAAIDCVAWWQVAQGTSTGSYTPAAAVNRGQMASFIARLVIEADGILPTTPADQFPDDDGAHEPNIDRLAAAGIVTGKADGTYGPTDNVNRGQMATFLTRAYQHLSGRQLTAPGDYFTDDNGTAHEPNINRAAQAGFTGGTGDGYNPGAPVTRAQMASFLARVLDLAVEQDLATLPPAPTPSPTPTPEPDCDPSYPDVCIPPPPPDLNCGDIPHRNFRVRAPDPHNFDGNGDGVGCQS